MSPQRSSMLKKKKSYWSVSEIDPSPPQSWRTDRQTDGQTDGRTDRRTTDKSVLEKLRCLSAGGAKNCFLHLGIESIISVWKSGISSSAIQSRKWAFPMLASQSVFNPRNAAGTWFSLYIYWHHWPPEEGNPSQVVPTTRSLILVTPRLEVFTKFLNRNWCAAYFYHDRIL